MIYLKPFDKTYFEVLKSWVGNADELLLFSGPTLFRFPLTDEQLDTYIADPARRVYAVMDNYTNEPLGMGEIFRVDAETVRLCRILLGVKQRRGGGIGRQITQSLVDIAFSEPQIRQIELYVYDFNTPAIACYGHCGFRIDPDVAGPPSGRAGWNNLRMYLDRSGYTAPEK